MVMSTTNDTRITPIVEAREAMPDDFSPEQAQQIAGAIGAGQPPMCPICFVRLDSTKVPPRGDVSYVRNRVWLVCASCHRGTVLDRPRP